MYKAYKFRIYPNKAQECLLNKHFGCARWIYNWGLERKMKAYQNKEKLSCIDLDKELTNLKKVKPWLSEVNSQTLCMALRNLDNAYQKFFSKTGGFPKFKSKELSRKSFQCNQGVKFSDKKCYIPKFKEGIKIKIHRFFRGKIKKTTLSQNSSGKYYISVLVETEEIYPVLSVINPEFTIGIDTGIKTFVTDSNGREFQNKKFLSKHLKKLKRLQRSLSRKKEGSRNRKKSQIKLAKFHEKIANQRKDYIHKVSNALCSEGITSICVEDLNLKLMSKHLIRNILDIGIGEFYSILEYKCNWKGINFIKIGRWDASSKTCNSCGKLNNSLSLKDREWICSCGFHQQRDLGAAINIKNFGLLKSNSKLLLDKQEVTLGEI